MATQQVVNVGTQANDATGDLLRDAFTKINNNFAVFFTGNFPTAQMTIGPPLAGTALTVIGLAGQSTISANGFVVAQTGAVSIAAPSTVAATLTLTGASGASALTATAFSATDSALVAIGNVVLGASGSSTITMNGGVTIGSPTGGNKGTGSINVVSAFVNNVAVFAGTPVTTFTSNTGLSANVAATGAVTVTNTGVVSLAGTANQIAASASTGAVTLSFPANVIVPAPGSGTSLTVNGVASNSTLLLNNTHNLSGVTVRFQEVGNDDTGFEWQRSSSTQGVLLSYNRAGSAYTNLNIAALSINLQQSGTTAVAIAAGGNVSIPAPASGDNLLLTNVAGGNALTLAGNSAGTAVLRLNTQATTGAQTATFAANNKPGSGTTSPDKWIPVNLDGTLHYVPAFL